MLARVVAPSLWVGALGGFLTMLGCGDAPSPETEVGFRSAEPTPSGAPIIDVFGPQLVVRAQGQPTTEVFEFSLPAGVEGPFTVFVENDGVSSARVWVNGEEVFGPSDFNPSVEMLEEEVVLLAENELSVKLMGSPQSSVHITVAGTFDEDFGTTEEACLQAVRMPIHGEHIVILYEDEDASSIASELETLPGVEILGVVSELVGVMIKAPTATVEEIGADPRVEVIGNNVVIPACSLALATAAPGLQPTSLGIMRVGASHDGQTQTLPNKGQGVGVAVVDTGIDPSHPYLQAASIMPGYSYWGGSTMDEDGHGTGMAGIIAAASSQVGLVGIAPQSSIYPVKIFGSDGTSAWRIWCGLNWVSEHSDQIQVANLSLGFHKPSLLDEPLLYLAILRTRGKNITVVGAGGNIFPGSTGMTGYFARDWAPARFDEVVSVTNYIDTDGKPGGLGSAPCDVGAGPLVDDSRSPLSPHGVELDIAAPGTCVEVLALNTAKPIGDPLRYKIVTTDGSSNSAAYVSGAIALLQAKANPQALPGQWLTPAQVRNKLEISWEPGPMPGDVDGNPEGLLRVGAAVSVELQIEGSNVGQPPTFGRVAATDQRVDCGQTNNAATLGEKCKSSYFIFDEVTLEAVPNVDTGLVFKEWVGDCAEQAADQGFPASTNPVTIVVEDRPSEPADANKACTAVFTCPSGETWDAVAEECTGSCDGPGTVSIKGQMLCPKFEFDPVWGDWDTDDDEPYQGPWYPCEIGWVRILRLGDSPVSFSSALDSNGYFGFDAIPAGMYSLHGMVYWEFVITPLPYDLCNDELEKPAFELDACSSRSDFHLEVPYMDYDAC